MKKLWTKFTDYFGRTILHPQFIINSYNYEAIAIAKEYSKGHLVDIGCGRMPYRAELEPLVKKYTGLDHPKTSKLYANSKYKTDIYADAHKIPLKQNSVDTVLMLNVLEYLNNPSTALSEVARVLKPGGVVILVSPFMYPIHDGKIDRQRLTLPAITDILKDVRLKPTIKKYQGGFWEFWFLCLLVFYFKRVMELSSINIWTKLLSITLIIVGLVITSIINTMVLGLKAIASLLPKFENDYPINVIVVAKK